MYLAFYGLNHKPFSISPDPEFLWLSPQHQQAISVLQYGLLEDKGFLVLTGEVGTGKTLLIKNLIRNSPTPAIIVDIPDPDMKPIEFFRYLAEEAGMEQTFSGKGEFLIQLKHFLLEAYGSEKKVLLIIDESQRLNHELLEQIRLLSNLEIENRKLINIFFIGQNEFNTLLQDERSKATSQRIAVRYSLKPFTEDETGNYIKHRLKIAGCTDEIFNRQAIQEIHRYAQGYPRTINVLCDNALLMGSGTGFKQIGPDIVIACEDELAPLPDPVGTVETELGIPQIDDDSIDLTPQTEYPASDRNSIAANSPSSIEKSVVISILFLLIVGFAGYYIYTAYGKDSRRWTAEDIAPKQNLLAAKNNQKEISNRTTGNKKSSMDELIAAPDKETVTKPETQSSQDQNKKPVNKGVKDKPKSEIKLGSEVKTVAPKNQQQKTAPTPVANKGVEKAKERPEPVKTIAPPPKKIISKENIAALEADNQSQPDSKSNANDIVVPENYNETAAQADTEKSAQQKISPARLLTAGQTIMVYFDFESTELPDKSKEKLNLIAQMVDSEIHSKILIEGFTDTSGNYWANKSLSQKRANIVKNHLVALGKLPGQIIARGMGPENPITDNNTHEGRKRNRRVEITILQ